MRGTHPLIRAALAATTEFSTDNIKVLLQEPTIIVSAPRSGSHLLFELLTGVAGVWSIGGESHGVYAAFPQLRAENAQWDSGRLLAAHADPETRQMWRRIFLYLLRDRNGAAFIMQPAAARPMVLNALEKTPRNALNIPFLLKLFPGARFIYLHRDPKAAIASLVEAWKEGLRSGRFVTFKDLPGWDRPAWCFLLPPGWRSMTGKSLVEIAAFQWQKSNTIILDQLATLPPERRSCVSFAALLKDPNAVRARLSRFVGPGLESHIKPVESLPLSRTALTPPHPDKWKKYETEIMRLLPSLDEVIRQIESLEGGHSCPP